MMRVEINFSMSGSNFQAIEDRNRDGRGNQRHHNKHGEEGWREYMRVVSDVQHDEFD